MVKNVVREVRRRERKTRRHGKPFHDILPTTARKGPVKPRRLTDDSAFVQLSELVNMRDPREYEIRTA